MTENDNMPIADLGYNKEAINKRAIDILNEVLSGQSAKSKNELIKEALRALKNLVIIDRFLVVRKDKKYG